MSTQKNQQPGEPAHKHISFTPANEANGSSNSPDASQPTADNAKKAESKTSSPTSSSAQRQPAAQQASKPEDTGSTEGGALESGAKSWLNQQQWLPNVDVNQLSKQAQDLGSKAKELGTKAVDQVNRLTPRQKVIGGALLVGGLSWLALRSKSSSKGETYRSGASYNDDNDTTTDSWQGSSESVYRGARSRSYSSGNNRDDAWVE